MSRADQIHVDYSETSGLQHLDWNQFAAELDSLTFCLADLEFLSHADYERYRFHLLTFGLVESDFEDRLKRGAFFIFSKGGSTSREINENLAEAYNGRSDLPAYLHSDNVTVLDLLDRARTAIEQRQLSLAFVKVWGRLQSIASLYVAAAGFEEERIREMRQAIKGGRKTVEIQKYWYAHWLRQNAPSLKPKDRDFAINSLSDLCCEIKSDEVAPWGPYPRLWYEAVLSEKGNGISEGIRRQSTSELREKLNHRLITRDVLPPLSREEFGPSAK